MGAMTPPSRKSCYNFRVIKINRVVDGDTIDVTIDLGFDLFKKERVRVAGVDTPEKRTRDLEEKKRGLAAKQRVAELLDSATEVQVISHGVGKFGRCLGEIDFACPDSLTMKNLNKQLIEEGHAIEYHGGKR